MARLEHVTAGDIDLFGMRVSHYEFLFGVDEDRDDPENPGMTWATWHDRAIEAIVDDDAEALGKAMDAMLRVTAQHEEGGDGEA